jgi:hypothetical protein
LRNHKDTIIRNKLPSSQNIFAHNNDAQPIHMDILDIENDRISDMVQNIFLKYDTDGSGYLEKRETLKVVNDVLNSQD